MSILRNQLRDLGYEVHETLLQAAEWNSLEHRERMSMVAVTRGISFDWAGLQKPERKESRLGDVLESIPDDAPCWSQMAGLKAKEIRDKEAGKGFAMQIVTHFATKCPTITKGYAKIRSTDPKLQNPSNPDLLRQFTPKEHARIKGIPEELIEGLSATTAHELLGQSICYAPFKAVGALLAKAIQAGNPVTVASTFRLGVAG